MVSNLDAELKKAFLAVPRRPWSVDCLRAFYKSKI
jgi:hypothetical protein